MVLDFLSQDEREEVLKDRVRDKIADKVTNLLSIQTLIRSLLEKSKIEHPSYIERIQHLIGSFTNTLVPVPGSLSMLIPYSSP